MPQAGQRWIEVTPSQFTHEAEGLNVVRSLLPQSPPFRAWSNFEFRDGQGKWHEVDLLVLGRRRLHLVELKYYSGTLCGDDLTWRRDGHRAEDSPLKLARRKAQRLASKLQEELIRWAQETGRHIADTRREVPFVQECVFLHHPGLRCELPLASRTDLFGLDDRDNRTGLPGISGRLLEAATPHQPIPARRDETIVKLMERIGVVQRRQREAGSWVIDEDPLGEGDGWQDWPAFHRVATTRQARIRFLVTSPGAPATERARVRRVAEHEFRIMRRLPNERLLRPEDMVENDLGVGLVYSVDERFQRLDLWLADEAGKVTLADQLSLLRQVAEAVSYAHQNRVVHRGLTRRLGTGSTAVGLLVSDLTIGETGREPERVLKVAIDTAAAGRLADEAKVLSGLRHPRLVHLVEGPVEVGGRQALVLESAGDQTLGEVLRDRERLSLDLLERWGTDLLEALVALGRAGVDHRDIKPANLGVKEIREKREDWVRRQKLGVLQKLTLPLDNPRDRNCLAIFTCDRQSVYLQLWRSLFQKYAPGSIENVEAILGVLIGKGTKYRHIPEELLDVLADAYREAPVS